MQLKAYGKNIEKIFTIQPGGDPKKINIRIEGANNLQVNNNGELVLETDLGEIKFSPPLAYQEKNGEKKPIQVAYLVHKDHYQFKLGTYDPSLPLVIDPMLASTFLGGSGDDVGYAIAASPRGGIYVTGYTASSDFPVTSGAYDSAYNSLTDVFVAKFDNNLSQLQYATFLGGSGDDIGRAICLDHNGDVFVVGRTNSSNFPTVTGSYDTSYNGGLDVFVAKLNDTLSILKGSTFLGGPSDEEPFGCVVNHYGFYGGAGGSALGDLFVVGKTAEQYFSHTTGRVISGEPKMPL